jgi:hypothetical protein
VLCGTNEENTNYLFVDCSFTKNIWFIVQKELKLESRWEGEKIVDYFENRLKKKENWEGEKIVDYFENRLKKKENWKELPGYLCWEVWKHRNLVIFEGRPLNRDKVCNSILQDLG